MDKFTDLVDQPNFHDHLGLQSWNDGNIAHDTQVFLAQLGVCHVDMGHWTMFLKDRVNTFNAQGLPIISLSLLFNPETGQFVSRVFNRLLECGSLHSEEELRQKCQDLLGSKSPCRGLSETLSEEFPLDAQFSASCAKIVDVPVSSPMDVPSVCQACAQELSERLVESDIRVEEADVQSEPDEEIDAHTQEILNDIITQDPCVAFAQKVLLSPNPPEIPERGPRLRSKRCSTQPDEAVPDPRRAKSAKKVGPRPASYEIQWEGQTLIMSNSLQPRESLWQCPVCSGSFQYRLRFIHMRSKHQIFKMSCLHCPEVYLSLPRMLDHLQESHPEHMTVQCVVCAQELDLSEGLERYQDHFEPCYRAKHRSHLDQSNKKKVEKYQGGRFVCDLCGSKFNQKKHLNAHVRSVHEAKQDLWTCHECSKTITLRCMHVHLRELHFYATFHCPQCTQRERTSIKMSNHILMSHPGVSEAPCPECKALVPTLELVSHHKQCWGAILDQRRQARHQRDKSFPHQFACSVCAKTFGKQFQLNAHMRGHKNLAHACTQCSYRTHSKARFEEHMETIHSDHTKCFQCEQVFLTPNQLTQHLKESHDVSTMAECDLCGAFLKDGWTLRLHRYRVHEAKDSQGQKPWPSSVEIPQNQEPLIHCEMCQASFQTGNLLKAHLLSDHPSQQVSYRCNHCEEIFRFKSGLFSHLSIVHHLAISNVDLANEGLTTKIIQTMPDANETSEYLNVINPNVIHTTRPMSSSDPTSHMQFLME